MATSDNDIRDKNKRRLTGSVIRSYPEDIHKTNANFPYMKISIIEYRPFIKINEKDAEVSKISEVLNIDETKNYDGFTPIDKKSISPIEQIILPIPQSIQDNIGITWEMANNEIIQSTMQAAASVGDMGIGDVLKKYGINLVQGIGGNVIRPFTGYSSNPKKQAIFHSPEPRVFNFDFIFTPTSEKEAETVINIIRSIKKYSLPKASTSGGLFQFPKEFVLEFHGVAGFPEIDSCVCMAVSTNYTTATLQLLKSGHPVQLTMGLTFQEVTLRTEDYPGI